MLMYKEQYYLTIAIAAICIILHFGFVSIRVIKVNSNTIAYNLVGWCD